MALTMPAKTWEKGGSGNASTVSSSTNSFTITKDNPLYEASLRLEKKKAEAAAKQLEEDKRKKYEEDEKRAKYYADNIQPFVKTFNDIANHTGGFFDEWRTKNESDYAQGLYTSLNDHFTKLRDSVTDNSYIKDVLSEDDYIRLEREVNAIGKSISDAMEGIKQTSDVYAQYKDADSYNKHLRLSGMSSDELQEQIDALDKKSDYISKLDSSYETGYTSSGDLMLPMATKVKTKEYEDFLKKTEAERVELTSYKNNAKYREDVEKYGVDPASMTYDEITEYIGNTNLARRKPDQYDFVKRYYDSQSNYDWQMKRSEEFVKSLGTVDYDWIKKAADAVDVVVSTASGNEVAGGAHTIKRAYEVLEQRNGWTPEEIREKVDLAKLYIDSEERKQNQAKISERMEKHPVLSPILENTLSVLTNIPGSIMSFGDSVSQAVTNKVLGNDLPINTNTAANSLLNYTNDVREETRKQIEKKTPESGKKVALLAYDTLMTIADVSAGSAIGGLSAAGKGLSAKEMGKAIGRVSGMISSSTAAANKVQESIEAGDSNGIAIAKGAIVGAIEYIAERIPIDYLVAGIVNGDTAIKTVLKGALSEGTEEVVSNILAEDVMEAAFGNGVRVSRSYNDYLAQGYKKERALEKAILDVVGEDAETFVSAAIAGAAFGGITAVTTRANDKATAKMTQDAVANEVGGIGEINFLRGINRIMEAAEESHNDAGVAQAAQKINDRITFLESVKKKLEDNGSLKRVVGENGVQAEIAKVDAVEKELKGTLDIIRDGSYDATKQDYLITERENALKADAESTAMSEGRLRAAAQRYVASVGSIKKAVSDLVKTKNNIDTDTANLQKEKKTLQESIRAGKADATAKQRIREINASIKKNTRDADRAQKLTDVLTGNQTEFLNNALGADQKRISKALSDASGRNVSVQYDSTMGDNEMAAMRSRGGASTLVLNPERIIRAQAELEEMGESGVNVARGKVVHEAGHLAARTDGTFVPKVYEVYASLRDSKVIPTYAVNEADIKAGYRDSAAAFLKTKSAQAEIRDLVTNKGMSEEEATRLLEDRYMQEEYVMHFLEYLENNGANLFNTIVPEKRNAFVEAMRKIAQFFRDVAAKIRGEDPASAKKMDTLADKLYNAVRDFAGGSTTAQESVNAKTTENTAANKSVESEGSTGTQESDERKSLDVASAEDEDGVYFNDNGDAIAADMGDGSTRYSLVTYREGGRDTLVQYLDKRVAGEELSRADADDIIAQMDAIYDLCEKMTGDYKPFGEWSTAVVDTDEDGNPIMSVIKPNGEYVMNLDFSLVCKKRRALDAVFKELIRRGTISDFDLGQEQIVQINDIIRKHGFEIACQGCFVEAKRFRQAKVADTFVNMYNSMVKSMAGGKDIAYFNFGRDESIPSVENGIDTMDDSDLNMDRINAVLAKGDEKTVPYKIAKHLKENPSDRKLLSRGDFMSSESFENVTRENPAIMSLYNSKKGSGGPKAAFGDVQYLSDIIRSSSFNAEKAFSVGGVRVQSFSDYVARLVFDYVQMVGDLAAKALPAHAYTKEALFVKQFGLTGMKINMSLFPARGTGTSAGLNADGSYAWADESFDYDTAIEIQNDPEYAKNCGTICVGVSDAHIRKLLADDNIRMVIPYHKSGLNPVVAKMNNIDGFKNYTNEQNTRYANGKKLSKEDLKSQPNFNDLLHSGMDAVEASRVYVEWCEDNGYLPKFDRFAYNADGTLNENYYKLLEDFTTMVDGKYYPQEAVKAVFPNENSAFGSMESLIREGLEEDAAVQFERDAAVGDIVDEIESVLGEADERKSLATSIYIKDGHTADGETVDFVNLILDGKKKGETRNHKSLTRKWVGIAKDGYVYGRVRFGEPYLIDKDSPEYADTYIEGTEYDIKDGEQKYYYPILEVEDFRDAPKPITKHGNYAQYEDVEDVRYSISEIVDENNNSYGMGVKLDSTLLDNLTPDERIEMVKERVKELGGSTFTAYDNNGNAVDVTIAKSSRTFKNKNGRRVSVNKDLTTKYNKNETKQEAVVLVDELIETAHYLNSDPAKHPHDWLDNNGKNDWERWTTYIEDKNNTIWEATLNVANATNGEKILYDISPIKKVGRSGKSDAVPTDKIVPQNPDIVNTSDEDSRNSLVLDSKYMSAIERGDMDEVQRMVDEAARAAGYSTRLKHGTSKAFTRFLATGSKTKSKSATLGVWFSDSQRTAVAYSTPQKGDFDDESTWDDISRKADGIMAEIKRAVFHEDKSVRDKTFLFSNGYWNLPALGDAFKKYSPEDYAELKELGVFVEGERFVDMSQDTFTNEKNYSVFRDVVARVGNLLEWYNELSGGRIHPVNLSKLIMGIIDNGVVRSLSVGEVSPRIMDVFVDTSNFAYAQPPYYKDEDKVAKIRSAIRRGKNGVVFMDIYDGGEKSNHYVVFDSKKIKSADPITYDDKGNIIPLSERFNSENDDIRYSKETTDKRIARLKEDKEFLKQQMEKSRSVALSPADVDKIVKDMRDQFGFDNSERDNIKKMLKLIDDVVNKKIKSERMDEVWDSLARNARSILEGVYEVDSHLMRENEKFVERVRSTPVSVPSDNKNEFEGGYGEYRNENRKYVNLSSNGIPVATVYSNLCDEFPGILDGTVEDPIDMVEEIVSVMKSYEPVDVPKYTDTIDQASQEFVNVLGAKYMNTAQKTYAQQMREKADEIRKDKFDRRVAAEVNRIQSAADRTEKAYKREIERIGKANDKRLQQTVTAYEARLNRIENAAARDAMEYERIINRYRDIEEAREFAGDRKEYARRIRQDARALRSAAVSPNSKKFVPEGYRKNVENIALWLDRVSVGGVNLNSDDAKWTAIAYIRDDINKVSAMFSEDFLGLANGLLNQIEDITGEAGRAYNKDLKAAIFYRDAYKLGRLMRKSIADMNKVYLLEKRVAASMVANEITETLNHRRSTQKEFESLGDKKSGKIMNVVFNKNLSFTDARSFFHRMGKAGDNIYETLREAQSRQYLYMKQYTDKVNEALSEEDLSRYAGEKQKVVSITLSNGKEYTLTAAQAMNIVTLYERSAGKSHIEKGGVRIYDPKTRQVSKATALTEKDIASLRNALDDTDKKVMRVLADFMRDECTAWGNEATMEKYGFHRFTTRDYFPISVDRTSIGADMKTYAPAQFNVENVGFAKTSKDDGSAPVLIDSMIDVANNHIRGMATYAAYLNVEDGINRIMKVPGVVDTMKRALGSDAEKYITEMMNDLKGAGKTESLADNTVSYLNKLAGRYKAAAVSYNTSTVAKQPLSYLRAAAVLDAKYLVKGATGNHKVAYDEMMKHSGIAVRKEIGYSDVGVGKTIGEQIGYTERGTLKSGVRKFNEFGMAGAALADRVTWESIWLACKAEQAEKNAGAAVDRDALMEATAKRFADVVAQTQVVDSALDSAPVSRSNNPLVRFTYAFMSEPVKGYNLLVNALDDFFTSPDKNAKSRAAKHLARVSAYTIVGWAAEAAITSAFSAIRDDDDEILDKFSETYFGNLGQNALGILPMADPIVDAFLEVFQGYTPSNMADQTLIDVASGMVDAFKTIMDAEGKRETPVKAIRDAVESVATMLGVPVKNIVRMVNNTAKSAFQITNAYKASYELQKIWYNPNNATAREKNGFNSILADAYLSGDREAFEYIYEDMRKMGLKPQQLVNSIAKDSYEDDIADKDKSSLVKYTPGSDAWYIGMKTIFNRDEKAPKATEDEITRVYKATGETSVLPKFKSGEYSVDSKEREFKGDALDKYLEDYGNLYYEIANAMRDLAAYRKGSAKEQAWWLTKAEKFASAAAIYAQDKDYSVTSVGKWVSDYIGKKPYEVAQYIVGNLEKK